MTAIYCTDLKGERGDINKSKQEKKNKFFTHFNLLFE